jgi:hypothetical protein
MRSTLTHPPNPTLAIRVGVAGTLDPVDAAPDLSSQIRSVLRLVKEIVLTIHGEPESGYDPTVQPKLILICALAAGVDQFVADIALDEGYRLHVPLAYPRNKYVEMNFERTNLIQAHEHFDRLYALAESKLELDGAETEDKAYDTAGSVLVGHSDLLLAVWDLGPGKGPGGTADSVKKAIHSGIPVVKFDSRVQADATLEYRGAAATKPEELKPILRDILQEGLRPPHTLSAEDQEQTKAAFAEERENLQRFLEESEKRTDWSPPYKLITGLLALKLPNLEFRLEPYQPAAEKAWAPVQDTQPDCARSFFQSFDMWPDSLAVYYSSWMRGIVAFSLVVGSIIVGYVLATRLWPNLFPPWLETASGIIALISALLIWWANHRSVHRRWLQYRMLSEDLRNAALALAIGVMPRQSYNYRSLADFQPNWVAFYTKACIRAFGLGNARFDGAYLSDYRTLLIERVKGQFNYHRGRSDSYTTLNRHVRRLLFSVFLITSLGAVLQVIYVLAPVLVGRYVGEDLVRNAVNVSLEFTVLSAAIAALAAQESFAKLAQASANTAIHLNQLDRDIKNAPLTGIALREQAERAREELRREHEDWYLLYSLREIEYS